MDPTLYDHVKKLMDSGVCTTVEKNRLPEGIAYIERDVGGVFVGFSESIDLRKLSKVAFNLGYAVNLEPNESSPTRLFVGFADTDLENERIVYKKPIECFSKNTKEYFILKKNKPDVLEILSFYQRKVSAAKG